MADRQRKNRQAKGEIQGSSKLTAEIVESIRSRYALGEATQYKLADEFGVCQAHISIIINGKSWKHITT